MSEHAAYWYITERASIEELEALDARIWPTDFDTYMEGSGNLYLKYDPVASMEMLEQTWRHGAWLGGVIHAQLKQQTGHEEPAVLWWCKDFDQL